MIFAAGLGTRLKPFTDFMPKALVPVAGKPLLEHVAVKLRDAGCEQIVVNVHHFPEQIIDFLDKNHNFDTDIRISDESDLLLDTGGGLRKAAHFFDDGKAFIVHNVDILSNLDLGALYKYHTAAQSLATIVASSRETQRYFLFDGRRRLRGWTNIRTGEVKPAGAINPNDYQKLAFAGIQVVSPNVFDLMGGFPETFSITDFYIKNAGNAEIRAYVPENFKMMDVGKTETLKQANVF
jgi:NDP-sugar pyrophosphorylase family protein